MGRDKATMPTPWGSMASVVAGALLDAGCGEVFLVGGDQATLASKVELPWLPDIEPGEGPLTGVASIVAHRPGRSLVVCACDLPWLRSIDLAPLVRATPPTGPADAAVYDVDGTPQWSVVSLSATAAAAAARAFSDGERAIHRAVGSRGLKVVHLEPARPGALSDVDRPEDLPSSWGPDDDRG